MGLSGNRRRGEQLTATNAADDCTLGIAEGIVPLESSIANFALANLEVAPGLGEAQLKNGC
jgi:hypothetical protein